MRAAVLVLFGICLAAPAVRSAQTITVNPDGTADFTTIQAAIIAAHNGDTVIVEPGIYTGDGNREIRFLGKAITLRSIDPNDGDIVAGTVIDCNSAGRGFVFDEAEGQDSVLAGFTVTNGYHYEEGGGIYCYESSPTITHCVFTYNRTQAAWSSYGSGIDIWYHASPMISNCKFIGNSAEYSGGGIYVGSGCYPVVLDCEFIGNRARLYGGGVFFGPYSSSGSNTPLLINCTFSGNSAGRFGGGVSFGFDCRYGSNAPMLINCVFTGNSAYSRGGGIHASFGNPRLFNCVFTENSAGYYGGGICSTCTGSLTLANCILWGNTDRGGMDESAQTAQIDRSSLTANYCCVQGWTGSLGGIGNIGADPLFADPAGGDYHVLANSPCIDTGDPDYWPLSGETDIDGEPRIMGRRVDMGVDEFAVGPTPIIGVTPTELEFIASQGGPNPATQVLDICNIGVNTLSWEITQDSNWLHVEPTTGNSTGNINEVTLSADITGLADGRYHCNLTISDPTAGNNPKTVEVNLTVQGPVIDLSSTEVVFIKEEGDPSPPDQTLTIRNGGGRTLNWEINYEGCNWLTVEPSSGSSAGEATYVTLSVDMTGLAEHHYCCYLIISDPNAENSPQTVFIYLGIEAPCFPVNDPDFVDWLEVGAPDCWCYARQCHGDADGDRQASSFSGYMWVSTDDLRVLINAWQVKEPPKGPGILTIPNGICADFDHQRQGSAFAGYMRVSTNDLAILIGSWQVKEPPKGPGIPPDCVPVPIEP